MKPDREGSARSPAALARLARVLLGSCLLGAAPATAATIEGRITLPGARTAPVVNQRYEIVTSSGVLSTNPPLAVVYLEGTFPRPAVPPVAELKHCSPRSPLTSRTTSALPTKRAQRICPTPSPTAQQKHRQICWLQRRNSGVHASAGDSRIFRTGPDI